MDSAPSTDGGESHGGAPTDGATAEPAKFQFNRKHGLVASAILVVLVIVIGVSVGLSGSSGVSEEVALEVQAESADQAQSEVINIVDEGADAPKPAAPVSVTQRPATAASTTTTKTTTTTTKTTTTTTTTTPAPEPRPANCSIVCEDVMRGAIPDKPVGLALHGAAWKIYPDFAENGVLVYCDCTNVTDGAWTVFQRRMDGSVDFYRNWANYTDGFGDVMGEFWLGLEAFYNFTTGSRNDVGFDLADWEGNRSTVLYRGLRVKSAAYNYSLISGDYIYSGFGNDMEKHHGDMFSTFDRPNNQIFKPTAQNCAAVYQGAWWYTSSQFCFTSHLNGIYHGKDDNVTDPPLGLVWMAWRGRDYSLKATEIKFRPSP